MDRFEFKVNGVKITVTRDDDFDGQPIMSSETVKRKPVASRASVSGDDAVSAAIAAAVHLYGQEWRDVENAVLTFNKVARAYSPWSSKFHGMNAYYKYKR